LSSPDVETAAHPDGEAAPAGDELRAGLIERLGGELGDALVAHHVDAGRDAWVRVGTEAWEPAGRLCRDLLGLRYFCFLSVIDWLPSPFGRSMDADVDRILEGTAAREAEPMVHGITGGDTRFQVFARLSSVVDRVGLTLKADIPDDTEAIASWTALYGGANWHEREAYEMYGIDFIGHPSLRKLYLPGDFEGHPLRKDFPLLARIVKPWPGIVDVEGMPGVADEEEGGDA
jgi:NADH-quinone oxidoreductase subunit C